METFTWCAINGGEGEYKYAVDTAQFGDGYEQSMPDGINNESQSWSLTFVQDRDNAAAIMAFFNRHQGSKKFIWTPPLGTATYWKVSSQKQKPLGAGRYQITATFEQAFVP